MSSMVMTPTLPSSPPVDADQVAAIVIDGGDVVRSTNPEADALLRRDADHVVGSPLGHLIVLHQPAPGLQAVLRQVRRGRPWSGPASMVASDGEVVVNANLSPLPGPGGGSLLLATPTENPA